MLQFPNAPPIGPLLVEHFYAPEHPLKRSNETLLILICSSNELISIENLHRRVSLSRKTLYK